jgi:hypothetical protein
MGAGHRMSDQRPPRRMRSSPLRDRVNTIFRPDQQQCGLCRGREARFRAVLVGGASGFIRSGRRLVHGVYE